MVLEAINIDWFDLTGHLETGYLLCADKNERGGRVTSANY